MGMFEKDFIRRMIQQLAQFVARALKLKEEQRYDEALQALDEAYRTVLDGRMHLKELDAWSAARLLGDGVLVRAYADLHREEGEIAALRCDLERAEANYLRALALYREALEMLSGKDSECAAAIAFLEAQLESTAIGARS